MWEKLNLLRGLWNGETAFAGPFAVTIDVTRRCNLRCVGCVVHSPYLAAEAAPGPDPSDIDVDMVARLCREMQAMGSRKLVLCGQGEPLLHPRLFDLVQAAKNSDLYVMLITNGTLIDNLVAHDLITSGVDLIRVTIWGSSRGEWAANYPDTKAEYMNSVQDGLRLLLSVKEALGSKLPRVWRHMVINRLNCRGVSAFVSQARDGRADAVSFSPLHTVRGPLAGLQLSPQEESQVIEQLRALGHGLRVVGLEENTGETIRRYEAGADARRAVGCYIPWTHPRVRVDGTVHPCSTCHWPVGNLRKQSLREVWNSPAYKAFRRHILRPAGPDPVEGSCDCTYCCHFRSNEKIHRVFRWLAPFARVARA